MKFNQEVTQNHPCLLNCKCALQNIYDIILKDCQDSTLLNHFIFFKENTKMVISGDELEKCLALNENKLKSVDIIFCITVNNINKMVLVELKLNKTNSGNIKKVDLENKIDGSKKRIGNVYPIYENYYFVFYESIKAEATKKIKNLFQNSGKYVVLSHKEIQPTFF